MAKRFSIDSSIAADIKSAASDSFKDNIRMIEVTKLKESIDNFYSLSDLDILADDIERQGLKHNLVVTEDADNKGTYFIKSGHRRYNAIKLLINDNRYNSRYVPCLIDGCKSKEESILDLIMLNATTRVMSDSELYKQYDILKDTLEKLKEQGVKVKGRLREKVADMLNISPAQVGKIENIKHNAVDTVIEAVENGELSIATADSIAKLPEEEQEELLEEKEISSIRTKDVKEKKESKPSADVKNSLSSLTIGDESEAEDELSDEEVDTNINFSDSPDDKPDTLISDELDDEEVELSKWEAAIKGYALLAAERAGFTTEQKNALLGGMIKVLSVFDKDAAEKKYLNR